MSSFNNIFKFTKDLLQYSKVYNIDYSYDYEIEEMESENIITGQLLELIIPEKENADLGIYNLS